MPEITIESARAPSPAVPGVEGGDIQYQNAAPRNFTLNTDIQIGDPGAKANEEHAAFHWDTSVIPMGSRIDKVKLEHKASASSSSVLSCQYQPLKLNSRLNAVRRSHHDGICSLAIQRGFPPANLWAGTAASHTDNLDIKMNYRSGIERVSQTILCTSTTGPHHFLFAVYWRLHRDGGLTGSVTTSIYEGAAGTSGSYYVEGSPIWTSAAIDMATLGTSPGSVTFTDGSAAMPAPYLVTGRLYTVTLDHTNSAGLHSLFINTKIDDALGDTQNLTLYGLNGDKVLQGFADECQFKSGARIFAATEEGSDTVPMPTFVSGTVYVFGSIEYSVDPFPIPTANYTELPTFKASVQAIIDARVSGDEWLGLRIKGNAVADARLRRIHSIRSTTATRDGLYGTLLTIHYRDPAQGLYRPKKYGRIARQTVEL